MCKSLYTTTPIQDNLGMRQEIMVFWDAVASAGPYANNLYLVPDG